MRDWGVRILLGLAAIAVATGAMAQKPPSTLRLIVPFPPGGPVDFVGRVIADGLRAQSNTAIVVDNRAGANGALGIAALKQTAPDGTTLLVVSSGMITFSPHFEKNLPYDAARDFAPVANAAYTDVAFVVANKVPANDLREFVALARSSAKPSAMGSAGQENEPVVTSLLAAIRCPTLVVCGAKDFWIPPKFSRIIAEKILGAQYVEMPHCGYIAVREDPAGSARLIRDFISRLAANT